MSLKDEIVAHETRLNQLATDLVGLELRADKMREDLRAQTNPLRKTRYLSPEAIGDLSLKLVNELLVIQENLGEAAAIRKALGK